MLPVEGHAPCAEGTQVWSWRYTFPPLPWGRAGRSLHGETSESGVSGKNRRLPGWKEVGKGKAGWRESSRNDNMTN